MEHLTDEGLKVPQPQALGLTDHVGLAPAADARRAGFDREPYARRPPPRPSASPKGGREDCAPALCESASPGGSVGAPVHKRDIFGSRQASKRGRLAFVHKAFIGVCDDRHG